MSASVRGRGPGTSRSVGGAGKRLLHGEDLDPLAGVANLFDAAMVFAVALLIAFVSFARAQDLLRSKNEQASEASGEEVPEEAREVRKFEQGGLRSTGEGVRLGSAYRLESGEIVYVPDEPAGAR